MTDECDKDDETSNSSAACWQRIIAARVAQCEQLPFGVVRQLLQDHDDAVFHSVHELLQHHVQVATCHTASARHRRISWEALRSILARMDEAAGSAKHNNSTPTNIDSTLSNNNKIMEASSNENAGTAHVTNQSGIIVRCPISKGGIHNPNIGASLPKIVQYKKSTTKTAEQIALLFIGKVREKLSASEQSIIFKAIVAMKHSLKQKDMKSYLKSAKTVVHLVIRCERFEWHDEGNDAKMLFLFFSSLPKVFKIQVELMSFELVFLDSSLGYLCQTTLTAKDTSTLRSLMGRLLRSLWCRNRSEGTLPMEEYLSKTNEILNMIGNSPSFTVMLEAYVRLIPVQYQGRTRLFVVRRLQEINAIHQNDTPHCASNSAIIVQVTRELTIASANSTNGANYFVLSPQQFPHFQPPPTGWNPFQFQPRENGGGDVK